MFFWLGVLKFGSMQVESKRELEEKNSKSLWNQDEEAWARVCTTIPKPKKSTLQD